MAGSIPVGSLVTDIKLNGEQPVRTLKELKQAVSGATSAWKAQEAVLKSAGRSTDAAKAKYKGLSDAVKNQEKYIEALTAKQKSLKKVQSEADRTTEKGKQAYKNATEEIKKNAEQTLRATTRLQSLTKQQEKAKSSLKYYSSGLAEAQKKLKQTQAVTKSYVERLKAEGKGYESAKAKLSGYKNSLENLNKQQKIQEQELSRIAQESGKSSDAYKHQEIRVNQTATSIAKLNNKVKSTQTEVNKLNPKGFNRIANGAKRVTNAADKMKSGLKGAWDHVKSGATVAAAGIGAVGAAAVSGAKKAGDLEQSYKEITNLAVTGGEKQKEAIENVSKMQKQGRDMSIEYGKSQQDIAEAYEELVKRGYTTKQALGAMRTELQGSVASGDDFKDVVAVSSTTLESFGMRADSTAKMTANTKRAVNELAYAADMTSTGFKDLGYGMSYVGSSAHQAGFGLSETASAMGILSNNGLEASKAGTGLNQVINRLSSSAAELAKGAKNNVLAKMGIKPKEIMNSKGQLKDLATVFGVLNQHMKGMSKVQKIDIMKSLFGMTGEQAGLILSKYNKQLGTLSKQTLEAGKSGKYVAELSAKNSQTAKMQMARLKQAGEAFTMTLGAKMLPAINKAGDELVVFLTKSKDGKQLTNDFAKAVEGLSNGIVSMIEWIAHHKTETKMIAAGFGAAYGVVKLANMVKWLNETRLAFKGLKFGSHFIDGFKALGKGFKGAELAKEAGIGQKALHGLGSAVRNSGKLIKATGKGIVFASKTMGKAFVKQLSLVAKGIKGLGKGIWSAAKFVGREALSAGKFLGGKLVKGFKGSIKIAKSLGSKILSAAKSLGSKALSLGKAIGSKISQGIKATTKFGMGKRVATGALAGAAVAAPEAINAVKDRHSADKRSQDIGGAVGALAGGTLTSMIPVVGPMLAPVGAVIGKYAGRWGGQAVNHFTKGWQRNKPPKNFWSLENLGYSAHNMWNGFTKGVSNTIKWFKKNWKEVGLYFINPLAGAINSLYKHNKDFHKWVNSLVKGFKNAWKGIGKWFSNIGKGIQKSWKGMTKFFSNLGKKMAKGIKSAWKGMTKWFSNIGKGIQKAWRGMTKWFSKLGTNMAKGLKKAWHNITHWFSNIAKGIQRAWHNMTSWFSNLGKNAANGLKGAWRSITKWFGSLYKGVTNAWHGLTSWFGKLGSGAVKGFKNAWHGLTSWFKGIIDGIKNAWDGFWDKVSGPIKTVQKFFSGKLKVGSLHLANGTDWRSRYGVPAILNDGNDSPETGNREGVLNPDGTVEVVQGRNVKRWLFPWQDVIKASDMKRYFGSSVHLARGTVKVAKDHYTKKNYELAKKRAVEDKRELDKLGDKISNALKRKDGDQARRLTAEFNKLDKKYAQDRKASRKPNPHAGKVLVDQGLLIGAQSRIGRSVWISESLFKKLTTAPKSTKKYKTKKRTTRKRKSTRRKSSTHRRSRSSSRSRVTHNRVVTAISASVRGSKTVRSFERMLKYIAGTHHARVKVSVSGTKSINSVKRALKSVVGKHKASLKFSYSGTYVGKKSIDRLLKSIGKLKKAKKVSLNVKYSGTYKAKTSFDRLTKSIKSTNSHFKSIRSSSNSAGRSLKSLGSRVTSVHSRINSLYKDLKKHKFGDDIKKQAEEAVKSLKGKGNFAAQFSKMTTKFGKDLSTMAKNAKSEFSKMWSSMESSSSKGVNKVERDFKGFRSYYSTGWSHLSSGIQSTFGHFWSKMRIVAGKGVNSVISLLNSAIGKIDSVVADFGGSKSAVSKVGLVKYATGTGYFSGQRRAITKPTLAMLNDGNDSPETGNRETVWDTKTDQFYGITGTNVPMLLRPGMEVFNATESKQLGFTHFATGTGALKKLYERAKHYWNKPAKTGNSMFNKLSGLTGAINELAKGMQSKAQHQGIAWWSQLWKMVEDKINDDDTGPAKGLLKAVEKLGDGTKYSQARRYGPDSFDCSGLVSKAMNEYYHKNWGALTVAGLWPHAHEISKSEAKPGDPIFWLPNYHVGVYAGHGMYYSAFSPDAHPQVGMHSIASSVPGVKPTFARFNGTNTNGSDSDSKDVKVKANSRLQKQIKSQVGKGFWATIQKIQEKYGESDIPGTATPEQARRVIKHAMEIAGVSGNNWLHGLETIASHESSFRNSVNTWDSNAKAGHPSAGWFQMIESTFRSYAKSGYTRWRNPLDQGISAIRYIKAKYGGINNVPGIVSLRHGGAYKGYANGGIANEASIFGEAGPEMAIPLIPSKSTRAWELIGKAVAIMSSQSGFGDQQTQVNVKEQKEERDFRQAVLLLLRQLVAKNDDINIKLTTPEGRTLWEVVKPFAKADQRVQQIRERKGLSDRRFS